MTINLSTEHLYTQPTDLEIRFSYENGISECIEEKKLLTQLQERATHEDFQGKTGESLIIHPDAEFQTYRILVFGLGKKSEFEETSIREKIAEALSKAKGLKPKKVRIVIPAEWLKKTENLSDIYQLVTEALLLSNYRFIKYKEISEHQKYHGPEEIILPVTLSHQKHAQRGIDRGTIVSKAIIFSRNLINEPSDVTTPGFLANIAREIARESEGSIEAEVFDRDDIKKLDMNAFLAVSKGSDEEPKFIRLVYKHPKSTKKVVVIGKGITFDTGGLSLKPSEHMETMKLDMSGAAAVLGVFHALKILKPEVSVVGLIAACENMPSGKSMKPGDIVKAMNGKTIEILNTDAEGRLTLADVLSYAVTREKPDVIIDLATLTGACMVALGEDIAGLWSNDIALTNHLKDASAKSGEKIWHMPLEHAYKPMIKSTIADIRNTSSSRWGGAVTAALFLSEFVGSKPWAHLDIAGPAFVERDIALSPKGGAGFGVGLILSYLISYK